MSRALVEAVLMLPALVLGQYVEREVFLPDSFVGALYPEAVCAVGSGERVYAAGTGGLPAVVALDPVSCRRTARMPVSGDILGLVPVSERGIVYALGRETLAVIDAATDSVVASTGYGNGPGIGAWSAPVWAFFAAGRLYGQVVKFDGHTHQLTDSIAVPLTPVDIAAHPSAPRLYVAGRQDTVAVLDASGDSVLRFVAVGDEPTDLEVAADLGRLYCASGAGRVVSVVDISGDTVAATIGLASQVFALAYDSGRSRLYCLGRYPHGVTVVDAGTNQVRTVVPTPIPQAMALDRQHARLYVTSQYGTLTVIDIAAESVVAALPVGGDCPQVATTPAGWAVVPSREMGSAAVVTGDTVAGRIPISTSGPRALVTAGSKLYVAGEQADVVDVLLLPGFEPVTRVAVGDRPWALCWNPLERKVYVACERSNRVEVIATDSDSVVAAVSVASAPRSLAWDSVGNKLYVGNFGAPELTVMDCRADTVVARIPTGRGTRRVVYNDRDRKVYLSCHDSETVEVVDCAADSVIARFSTGGSPWVSTFDRTDDLIYAGTSWGAPVICGAGDTLVGEITEDFYVKGACWNPHTGLVYMARNYDADILTIDGASHTVIARVGVPESPAEMATMTSSPRAYACHTSARAVTESVSVVCADSLVAAFRVRPSPVNLFCDSERGKVYVANWESSCLTVINDGPASVTEAGSTTGNAHPAASVVRGVLRLPYSPFSTPHSLFSLDGCKALALHPGPNDVSRLAPGVYFVTVNDGPNSVNATKVIIQH